MKPEDVIGILNRKVQNATVTEDQIDAAVEKYHKTHPLETDKTLTVPDAFADAKAVGDRFAKVEKKNTEQDAALKTKAGGTGIEFFFDSAKGCLAARIKVEEEGVWLTK